MALNNATILFPAPGFALLITLAQFLNPVLLGVAGGIGAAMGDLVGYAFGRGGHEVMSETRVYTWLKEKLRHPGPILFMFAASPLPFDLVGVVAGGVRYPLWRFLLWVGPGRVIKVTTIAVAGHFAMDWLLRVFGLGR